MSSKVLLVFCLMFFVPKIQSRQKVYGGYVASTDDAKHMVYIDIFGNDENICGGTLISESLVLTAAHCLFQKDYRRTKLIFGAPRPRNFPWATTRGVDSVIVHENYVNVDSGFDIALIKLDLKISNMEWKIKPKKLASAEVAFGSVCKTMGWGVTESGSRSSFLLTTYVNLINVKLCNDAYAEYGGSGLEDNEICAGDYFNGGKDSCNGDSGGPLICNNEIYGIVAWGYGCGIARLPGAYTNVYRYLDWIDTSSKKLLLSSEETKEEVPDDSSEDLLYQTSENSFSTTTEDPSQQTSEMLPDLTFDYSTEYDTSDSPLERSTEKLIYQTSENPLDENSAEELAAQSAEISSSSSSDYSKEKSTEIVSAQSSETFSNPSLESSTEHTSEKSTVQPLLDNQGYLPTKLNDTIVSLIVCELISIVLLIVICILVVGRNISKRDNSSTQLIINTV